MMDSKIKTYNFDCFPKRTLTVAYCKPSADISERKDHVLAQGLIVINASLAAANKCIVNEVNGTMKTKSLPAELLYSLSPSNHVTESLKTFGLSPGMTHIIFAAFDMSADTFKGKLTSIVGEDDLLDISDISSNADNERINKMYKVQDAEGALDEIVSTIAVKGI